MGQRDFAFLDAIAKTLVSGLPIEATVSFDKRTVRLTVTLRSLPDACARCVALERSWSPTVHDYADLEHWLRDRVQDFIAFMELVVPETYRDENRNQLPTRPAARI
jgi:hypothetical protein